MSSSKNKYDIVFQNGRVEQSWYVLAQEFPDRVEGCKNFLKNNPEDRNKAVGILKKLKGKYNGILQYDITKDDARVWYRVNRKDKLVKVVYAGHHPDKH